MILVVDDEILIRDIVCEELRLAGYKTLEAGSGRQALKMIETNPTAFHFVISDVVMADGNGIELLENMHRLFPDIPILLMSGFAELTVEQSIEKGAVGLVKKPFEFREILKIIKTYVHERKVS